MYLQKKRGGFREGSGRPKGSKEYATLKAQKYKEVLVREAVKHAKPLVKALIDKGLGGDIPALREIHDRAMGKVKEIIEISEHKINIDV